MEQDLTELTEALAHAVQWEFRDLGVPASDRAKRFAEQWMTGRIAPLLAEREAEIEALRLAAGLIDTNAERLRVENARLRARSAVTEGLDRARRARIFDGRSAVSGEPTPPRRHFGQGDVAWVEPAVSGEPTCECRGGPHGGYTCEGCRASCDNRTHYSLDDCAGDPTHVAWLARRSGSGTP